MLRRIFSNEVNDEKCFEGDFVVFLSLPIVQRRQRISYKSWAKLNSSNEMLTQWEDDRASASPSQFHLECTLRLIAKTFAARRVTQPAMP